MNGGRGIFVVGSFVAASVAYVDAFPAPGESLAATGFSLEAGGKGFNVAVGARRLGADVSGIMPIGNDLFATLALTAFANAELSAEIAQVYPGPTAAGLGFVDLTGENFLAVHAGANARMTRDDIRQRHEAIISSSLTFAQFEAGDDAIIEAFEIARGAGRWTLLNPSPFRAIQPAILDRVSVLILNEAEAQGCAAMFGLTAEPGIGDAGERFLPMADHAISQGVEAVIITRGGHGALLYRAGVSPRAYPAFSVTAVDTLGAGDAFAAGVAVGLSEGEDWHAVMRRAGACGAVVASRRGVLSALPNRFEVDSMLALAD